MPANARRKAARANKSRLVNAQPVYVDREERPPRTHKERRAARNRIRRPISSLDELHPDSALSEQTLDLIREGKLQFEWQLRPPSDPPRKPKHRQLSRDEVLARFRSA